MTKTSTKRRSIIISSIVIVVLVVSFIGAIVLINITSQKDNVIVSGIVVSTGVFTMFPTSIQTLEFTDTQTGTKTTYNFHFPPQSFNTAGNYSCLLYTSPSPRDGL